MDRKTMLERFLAAVEKADDFETYSDRLAAGMNADTRRVLMQMGTEHYTKMWDLWENMTVPHRDYVRAWRTGALQTMADFCQAYVAPSYSDPDANRYPVESIKYVFSWTNDANTACQQHTYVKFETPTGMEIYYSCLSVNQDGFGKDY